ncbi:MAG: hypothetical protein JWR22_900 [Herminiimonas sp.]|nr:hypothetical protein [Herminiimonas sp.]
MNLAPFYVLLWKHLLVVELIKEKYHITNEDNYKSFIRNISSIVAKRDRNKELALDYFQKWGSKFWQTTEQRIHELTECVESSLTASVGAKLKGVHFDADGAKKLSREQRSEVIEHGMDAVSKVQIRELENMLTVLEENIFDDSKNPYYITIDMLDEDWADDRVRFKLIRSLIDVVNRFKRLSNVKIILTLRNDLLYKVLNIESTSGFQEEKYKALYLILNWQKTELEKIIQDRINVVIKRHYTKGDVSFADIFPPRIEGKTTFDYMLERTFYRPRDIIIFVNECLALSSGRPDVSVSIIKDAESNYSVERLQSLSSEWSNLLPDLMHTSRLLFGLKDHFEVSVITEDYLKRKFEDIAVTLNNESIDSVTKSLFTLYEAGNANFESVRNFILREFYFIGLVGVKTGPTDAINWARSNHLTRLSAGQIRPSSTIHIHPMFYRALGIRINTGKF